MDFFGYQVTLPSFKKVVPTKGVNANSPQNNFRVGSNRSGSQGGDYRSAGAKWPGGLPSSYGEFTYDHYALRQNGRSAYQDSIHAHGLVTRWADSVADTGLRLDCNPLHRVLGITAKARDIWAADTEERFNLWAVSKNQNRPNVLNFYQSHRFYQRNKKRDGENFIRFYYANDIDLINKLQFEFIDPNQIRGDAYTSTLGPFANEDGIGRDDRGREVDYKVWNTKLVDGVSSVNYGTIPRIGPKSKRIMMLHCYEPEYCGQQRGFSGLAHFIQEFSKVTDFTSAQIQKAINQSNIVFTVENQIQDPSNPTADMPMTRPGGQAWGQKASTTEGAGSLADSCFDPTLEHSSLPEVEFNVPGSTSFFNTRQGDKLTPVKDTAPSDGFGEFMDSFLSNLVSSDSMPLSVYKMKMESSYSAARGELLLFYRSVMIQREEQSSDYLNPTFEMWLWEEIAAGRIKAPGFAKDPILRAAWLNCSWIGAPMPNIDMLRTAKGEKEYLAMDYTTGERGAREHNGSDFKANTLKNKKSFEEMPAPFWLKDERLSKQGENNDGKSTIPG
jgi:capsid protein